MDGQSDHSILLILITACLLLPACGSRQQSSEPLTASVQYSFATDWRDTKTTEETTDETLVASGFSVSARNCDTGQEELNDIALYDTETGVFRTEGFYRQDPDTRLDFYAAWPLAVRMEENGNTIISVNEALYGEDLVAASELSVDSGSSCINLHFKHLLGRLKIFAEGVDPGISYSLKGLSVASPAGGTYSFDEGLWYTAQYEEKAVAEGDDISVIPGTVIIGADWTCAYQGIIIASYHRNVAVEIKEGKMTTVKLLLTNDEAEELCFDASVSVWGGNPVNVEL